MTSVKAEDQAESDMLLVVVPFAMFATLLGNV